MKLAGQHSFEAPRDVVWEALLDPEVLAKTVPGCERLEQTGEGEYQGSMRLSVGPVEGKFDGTVQLSDLDPPNGYSIRIHGESGQGFVDGSGTVELEGDGPTELAYDLDAQVGGRLASIGQRLLERSARVVTRQALEGLERQIEGRAEAARTGEPAPEVEAPTQREFATGVAREVASEAISPRSRPWVLLGLLGLAVLIVLLATRACGA